MNRETGSLGAVYGIHLFEDSGRDIARSRLSRECHFILRMISSYPEYIFLSNQP